MSGFTPGPWEIFGISQEDGSFSIGKDRIVLCYVTNGASLADLITGAIKEKRGHFEQRDAHTQIANARLIAAAPELLEALTAARGLVEKWCHYQGDSQALFDQYLGPIDAAVAKARGES